MANAKKSTLPKGGLDSSIVNNQFLSRLVENLPGVAYRCRFEPNWLMEFISQGCMELTGYPATDFINGKINWGDIVIEGNRESLWISISNRIKERKSFQVEYQIRHSNGSIKWVWERGCAVYKSNGDIAAIEGYIADITERRETEEALHQSEQNYRELIEGMNETVWVIGLDGDIIDANNSATRNLGYSKVELISMGLFGLDSSLSRESIIKLVKDMPEDKVQVFETTHRAKDGRTIPVEICSSLVNYKGERAILSIARDITERRKAQDALQKSEKELKLKNKELQNSNQSIAAINHDLVAARQRAEESDRLKSAFLANMSHEIRTPMNSIIGFSETLLKTNLPVDKRERFTRILNTSCHQLLSIVNDVIDISKIETGQMGVNLGVVNFNQSLKQVQSMFQSTDENNDIRIVLTCPLSDDDALVRTDATKLNQILTNLLSNAIKFTEEGKVKIGYSIDKGYVKFFVTDQGIGIDPQDYQVIFDRFKQLEYDASRKYSGTGLGLAITKAFIEMLGGNIWVESKPGKGSTFFFTLPYIATQNSATHNEHGAIEGSLKDIKVLVAEDEEANQILLQELLEEVGARVTVSNDGQQAIEQFQSNPDIQIILMDISMPNMDGVAAMQEIKRATPDIPIVALTAFGFSGDRQKYLDAGFDGYVSKPIQLAELIVTINNLLSL